ncbi:unnamed protein product [Leptidea sinapis]|nr:unnamed protein product [Leptidea sinapis]
MPFKYILQVPGKQIRPKLTAAFNYWLQVCPEKLKAIGEIIQMLHNSSLLLDDVEDNSTLRRGIPVAHSIYGIASTINAANYVIIIALEKTLQLGHPQATTVYTEQLLELHRGQGLEIYWRDNFICPTEEEYRDMTIKKTGGLFLLAIRLMQLFSDNNTDFTKLSQIIGLYFQIRDDYSNLRSQEGKFSFPIIHAIRSKRYDNQVLHILRQRTTNVEVKRYCIKLLEKCGSFQYTRDTLQALDQEAREEIAHLGGNKYLEELLDEMLSWQRDNKSVDNVCAKKEVIEKQNEKLLRPFNYIVQLPGKRVRPKLIAAFNYWLQVCPEKLKAVGEIIQMLHNTSLLLDDVEDNSTLRRGLPVAHLIYGIASTINAANYVIIIALEKTLQLGHPKAATVYTEQLLELHRGQGLEIYWRDNFICPTEEEYRDMTIKIH